MNATITHDVSFRRRVKNFKIGPDEHEQQEALTRGASHYQHAMKHLCPRNIQIFWLQINFRGPVMVLASSPACFLDLTNLSLFVKF